jgi:hypothetical protein
MKEAAGAGSTITPPSALRPMGSWWPNGAVFPPPPAPVSWTYPSPKYPRNSILGVRPVRGERHNPCLIATLRQTIARILLRQLSGWHKIARQHFIDEFIIADQCKPSTIMELIETARELAVEVLAVLGYHGGEMPVDLPIDYLGDFPVVPLYRRNDKAVARFLKWLWDFAAATAGLVIVSPAMFVIAVLIKRDSPGPVLYISERIGRRGCTFSCLKFRTMAINADKLKGSLEAQNERDGPFFKMREMIPELRVLGVSCANSAWMSYPNSSM